MTQRSPMNDRYTTERTGGATPKSASSVKPATTAGASVRTESSKKKGTAKSRAIAEATQADTRTKEEKKADREKRREEEDRLYTASTILCNKDEKYKTYRKWWWATLVGAVVFTLLSWLTLSLPNSGGILSIIALVLAYACIIAALVLDVSVIRKRRNIYRDKVVAMSKKQVDVIIADSYVENRAKEEAKKARKKARKEGKDPKAAAKQAYDEVIATGSKGAEGYAELLTRAAAEKAEKNAKRKTLFGKSKASSAQDAQSGGSTTVSEVSPEDAASGSEGAASEDEEARKEAAAKAARDFLASRRSGTNK